MGLSNKVSFNLIFLILYLINDVQSLGWLVGLGSWDVIGQAWLVPWPISDVREYVFPNKTNLHFCWLSPLKDAVHSAILEHDMKTGAKCFFVIEMVPSFHFKQLVRNKMSKSRSLVLKNSSQKNRVVWNAIFDYLKKWLKFLYFKILVI